MTKTITLKTLFSMFYCAHVGAMYNAVNKKAHQTYSDFFEKHQYDLQFDNLKVTDATISDFQSRSEEIKDFLLRLSLTHTDQIEIYLINYENFKEFTTLYSDLMSDKDNVVDEVFEITDEEYQTIRNMFFEIYRYISERWAFTIQKNTVIPLLLEEHHDEFSKLHSQMNMSRLTGSTDSSMNFISDEFEISKDELKNSFNINVLM